MIKKISEKDQKIFQEAMRKIDQRISHNKIISKKINNKKATAPIFHSQDSFLLDNIGRPEVRSNDLLFYAKSGLQNRVIRKLKKGLFPIEDKLDLHGLRLDNARQTIEEFMENATQSHYQHLLIIHGKGQTLNTKPKIKNAINQWLPQFPKVLAFCSAKPSHGGTGAIYLLLARSY